MAALALLRSSLVGALNQFGTVLVHSLICMLGMLIATRVRAHRAYMYAMHVLS